MYDKSKYSLIANEIYQVYSNMKDIPDIALTSEVEIEYVWNRENDTNLSKRIDRHITFGLNESDNIYIYNVSDMPSILSILTGVMTLKMNLDNYDKYLYDTNPTIPSIYKFNPNLDNEIDNMMNDLPGYKPNKYTKYKIEIKVDRYNGNYHVRLDVSRYDGDDLDSMTASFSFYSYTLLSCNELGQIEFIDEDYGGYEIENIIVIKEAITTRDPSNSRLVEIYSQLIKDGLDYSNEEYRDSIFKYLNQLANELNGIAKEDIDVAIKGVEERR